MVVIVERSTERLPTMNPPAVRGTSWFCSYQRVIQPRGHTDSCTTPAVYCRKPVNHRFRAACIICAAGQINGLPQVLLVMDWSDLTPDQLWHWLRASVAVNGRSVTLYEEVHPRRLYGNRGVHRRFLARLAELLPAGCVLIAMTDAGFHSTWFKLIEEHGWRLNDPRQSRGLIN